MVTRYPAEYLGVANYLGSLKSGYRADLTHFDLDFQVHNVWVAGKQLKQEALCE
jgi:N-acetylglucosamine-6-phosphate deacetylase